MKSSLSRGRVASSRAFSLVQLLVVFVIIGIVIALLIPALRGARIQAKVVATRATLRDIDNACHSFFTDNKRSAGYFSPAQMGASANIGTGGGFTNMQNLLLDLAGGVTKASGAGIISVGPGGSPGVNVDPAKIGGSGSKGYFTPDKNLLVADNGLSGTADNKLMPQIVDAFGNPILAWVNDERPSTVFAANDSSTPAKYYWAANAGVLDSTAIGRDGRDQKNSSMLGNGYTAANRALTMAGLLGNPAYPKANTPTEPAAAKGPIVFQSAGADGFFMGSGDRGTKQFGTPTGGSATAVPYVSGTTEVMGGYDDPMLAGGN